MNLIQYARLHQSEVFTKTSVLESNESHNRDRVSRKRRDGDRSGPRKLFNTAHLKVKGLFQTMSPLQFSSAANRSIEGGVLLAPR